MSLTPTEKPQHAVVPSCAAWGASHRGSLCHNRSQSLILLERSQQVAPDQVREAWHLMKETVGSGPTGLIPDAVRVLVAMTSRHLVTGAP